MEGQDRVKRHRRRKCEELQAPVAIRLPVAVLQQIQQRADRSDRTISYVIRGMVIAALAADHEPGRIDSGEVRTMSPEQATVLAPVL